MEKILAREKPDAILPTMGGQTGLNLAKALAEQGVLERCAPAVAVFLFFSLARNTETTR